MKIIEHRDGADEPSNRKGRGLPMYQNLTFKRGITGHMEFWNRLEFGTLGARGSGRPGGVVNASPPTAVNNVIDATILWPSR